jgi:glycosyltransferase involved in cell wall biosynthesis
MVNKKIKVLHVIGKPPKGGVASFLRSIQSNIDTSKIQFDYLINSSIPDEEFEIFVKQYGGKVFWLPDLKYKNTIEYLKALTNFYRNNSDYKILHVHSPNIGVFNNFLAKKYNIKHRIMHSHSTKSSSKLSARLRNFFLLIPLRWQSNLYFACTQQAGKYLFGKRALNNGEVHIIKNGINVKEFCYKHQVRSLMREKLGIKEDFVVGHVGRFAKEKNHDFLINVFAEIHKKMENSTLILIGDGELLDTVKDKVHELGIAEKVIFLGDTDNVSEVMQAMDIFVLPSFFEGLGIVGIEAQASGLPCFVSTGVPEELDITKLVTHIPLQKGADYWAQQIMQSVKSKDRTQAFKEVLKSGYDIQEVAKVLEEIYSSI